MTGAICTGRLRVLSPGACGIKERWFAFQAEHTPLTSTNGSLNLHQYDGREVQTQLPCCSSHASDTQRLHLACGYHTGEGGRTSRWHFCAHKQLCRLALLWGFLGAGWGCSLSLEEAPPLSTGKDSGPCIKISHPTSILREKRGQSGPPYCPERFTHRLRASLPILGLQGLLLSSGAVRHNGL